MIRDLHLRNVCAECVLYLCMIHVQSVVFTRDPCAEATQREPGLRRGEFVEGCGVVGVVPAWGEIYDEYTLRGET